MLSKKINMLSKKINMLSKKINMLSKKIKVVYFVLVLILQSANGVAAIMSSHKVRYRGLTYLAVHSFNFASPFQQLWTLYDAHCPASFSLQFPVFYLFNAVLNLSTNMRAADGTVMLGTLTGMLTPPDWYQNMAAALSGEVFVLPPQWLTFEVLNSVYFSGAGMGTTLPPIPEE